MKLENLWLYAFDLSVKNGNSHNAVKIANEAVEGWRSCGFPYEVKQWQGEAKQPQAPQPETEEVVTGSWVWEKVADVQDLWRATAIEGIVAYKNNIGSYCFKDDSDISSNYPTLEAAMLEAERYYNLYVKPNE
jgi:hypothetical protein